MRYFKRIWFPGTDPRAVYYRVFPDGHYEYYIKSECRWQREITDNWHWYIETYCIPPPYEVSRLEILLVLGPRAVDDN